MRSYEDRRGEGLLRSRGQLRTKVLELEVKRGHGRGFFWEAGGQLGTGRANWKRVDWRLRIQDLVMWDFPTFSFFFFVPAPFIDGLLKILTEKVQSLSTSPRGPRRPAPYNGIFSTVSHTFTILISNFPQRWNKYFTETLAVINPIWKKIKILISIKFIVFRPLPRMISDQEIYTR